MRKRWTLAILVVLGTFFIAGIAGAFVSHMLDFWYLPASGFCAASAVVLAAYVAAPSRKFLSSCFAFSIGAIAAWILLEPSYYPENYELAYQSTHLPVAATYIGGMFGLIATGMLRIWSRAARPVKPQPLRGTDQ